MNAAEAKARARAVFGNPAMHDTSPAPALRVVPPRAGSNVQPPAAVPRAAEPKPTGRPESEVDVDEANRLHTDEGLSWEDVAEELGVHRNTLRIAVARFQASDETANHAKPGALAPRAGSSSTTKGKATMTKDERCSHCHRKGAQYPSMHAPGCPLRAGAKTHKVEKKAKLVVRDPKPPRGVAQPGSAPAAAGQTAVKPCGYCHRQGNHTPTCPRAVTMGRPAGIAQATGIVGRVRAIKAQIAKLQAELDEIRQALDEGIAPKLRD